MANKTSERAEVVRRLISEGKTNQQIADALNKIASIPGVEVPERKRSDDPIPLSYVRTIRARMGRLPQSETGHAQAAEIVSKFGLERMKPGQRKNRAHENAVGQLENFSMRWYGAHVAGIEALRFADKCGNDIEALRFMIACFAEERDAVNEAIRELRKRLI